MPYLTPDQLDERLGKVIVKEKNPLNGEVIVKEKNKGRGKAVDEGTRVLAGLLVNAGNTIDEVASELGINRDIPAKASRGLINNRFDPELAEKVSKPVEDRKEILKERALDVVAKMVENLATTEAGITPLAASQIAANMARISESMNIDKAMSNAKALIIVAPQMREENYYKVIDVDGKVE